MSNEEPIYASCTDCPQVTAVALGLALLMFIVAGVSAAAAASAVKGLCRICKK